MINQEDAEKISKDCMYMQEKQKRKSDFNTAWEHLAIDKYSEIEELYEAKKILNKQGHNLTYDEMMEIII